MIVELGRWVLREACRQVAGWRREIFPELGLSVNVSGRQLTDAGSQPTSAPSLAETGLDRGGADPRADRVGADGRSRRGHGTSGRAASSSACDLAIDDFGTGYSSLSYLRRFPVDELKIDKSFIDKMHTTEADLAIVRVVVELARIMGLRTTAEGVETAEQRRLLEQMGCQACQGYLIAHPLDAADVPAFLARSLVPRQGAGQARSAYPRVPVPPDVTVQDSRMPSSRPDGETASG